MQAKNKESQDQGGNFSFAEFGTRLLLLEFFFRKEEYVPESVLRREKSWATTVGKGKKPMKGEKLCGPMASTDVLPLVQDIADTVLSGLKLVGAYCQYKEYLGQVGYGDFRPSNNTPFVATYVFAVARDGETMGGTGLSDEDRQELMTDLQDLCRSTLWQATVYRNPFFRDGESVDGASTYCVQLKGRVQLSSPKNISVAEKSGDRDEFLKLFGVNIIEGEDDPLIVATNKRLKMVQAELALSGGDGFEVNTAL